MQSGSIFHRAGGAHAYPIDGESLRVLLLSGRDDLDAATCIHGDRYTDPRHDKRAEMVRAGHDERHDYWVATLPAPTRRVRYRFQLVAEGQTLWFGDQGFAPNQARCRPFHYAYINPADMYTLPNWLPGSVIYQVFPDRFWRGAPGQPDGVAPWGTEPTWWTKTGGDLDGIQQRLPWLQSLGVGCLYLTPVFASPSCHRYDTADYYRVDPLLGTEADLVTLVGMAHAAGIRVLLDGVFNHCGEEFFAFQDVLQQGQRSPYWDWFRIGTEPLCRERGHTSYESFSRGVPEMPKLMTQRPAVREYLMQVAEYWLRRVQMDGWRLDVANEVDHRFWREFRERVRGVNPQALILGEVWSDALPWLRGDQYDSVTHYPWRETVLDFLNRRLSVAQFDEALTRLRFMYPGGATGGLVHLLGSHDTPRILTEVKGSRALARLGAVLLFTAQGVPLVFYGDEVGMSGGNDPQCRRCMVWDEDQQNPETLHLYRRLIHLRRALSWLNTGEWETIIVDSDAGLYAYRRSGRLALNAARAGMAVEAPDEEIWVLVNISRRIRRVRVPNLPPSAVNLLTPDFEPLRGNGLVLSPQGAAIVGAPELALRLQSA